MRVVADTNVIISMLLWGKSLERLFVLINTRRITLCFSPQTIDELFRVVRYPHIQKQSEKLKVPTEALIDKLLAASIIVYPHAELTVIKEDQSDNRILEAAIASSAKHIISGDKHLLKAKKIHSIPILAPREFLASFN